MWRKSRGGIHACTGAMYFSGFHSTKRNLFLPNPVQGWAKRRLPGLVNVVTAVAYHLCLALPAAFTQPEDHLLAVPSSSTTVLHKTGVNCVKIHPILVEGEGDGSVASSSSSFGAPKWPLSSAAANNGVLYSLSP